MQINRSPNDPPKRESKRASKLKHLKYLTLFISCFTLSFITGSLTFIPHNSAAETASTESEIGLTLASSIALNITPNNLDLSLSPIGAGTKTTGNLSIDVSTNNPTGYNLTMNTQTSDTALNHSSATNNIPSTTNTSPLPLQTNTWGYNTTNNQDNFLSIPQPTGTSIKETTEPASTSQTTVTIGAITDTTLPAGTYTNTLQFTAVTNYVPPPLSKTGDPIQTVTTATCPTTRTRVVDARDNATYWIQKLADGKCWMLTNLAYGGGGDNTYNDVKTITNGSTLDYTQPFYFMPPGANRTTGTTNPSISTNGTGQYGYLYNWCAAMGGQTGTSACMNATTPAPDQNISICPSGWKLPGGGATATTTGNDFGTLNTAINNGSTTSPAGLLSSWLGMYSGYWGSGFYGQGINVYYWSSTQFPSSSVYAYYLYFDSSYVYPGTDRYNKQDGFAVRCLAL